MTASPHHPRPVTPEQAVARLIEGNRRWVEGRLTHPNQSSQRRADVAGAQAPFATIFCCLDSRVAPEIVFDCGVGDLAVVRTGAHTLGDGVVADSLQFGPAELGTPLLLVLGHQRCGAVAAAIAALVAAEGATAPALGAVESDAAPPLVQALAPAYRDALEGRPPGPSGPGELSEAMVRAHTRRMVREISQLESLQELVGAGALQVLGGYYALDSGVVSLLD